MSAMILDGQTKFGCTLVDFYRQPVLVVQAARFGVLIPPVTEVAEDAEPAVAYVNALLDGSARWIADCPTCRSYGRTGSEYVWLSQPLMFCMSCCNVALGGEWRRVVVPPNRAEIERLLLARPDPRTRNWRPDQTVEDLLVDQVMATGGGG